MPIQPQSHPFEDRVDKKAESMSGSNMHLVMIAIIYIQPAAAGSAC